jgi:hypothetical protein
VITVAKEMSQIDRGSTSVWRMTETGANSHTYFTHPVWLPDGTGFVFRSTRTGVSEAFLCEWPGGDIEQVTQGGASCPVVSLAGESVIYTRDRAIREAGLDGDDDRLVAEFPDGSRGLGIVGETADSRWLVAGVRYSDRTEIAKVPRDGGEVVSVRRDPRYITHVVPSPTEPGTLSAAWNLGVIGESPQRLWRIEMGTGHMEPIYPQALGELVTHEAWSGDGRWIVFTSGPFTRWPGSFSIRRIDPFTGYYEIVVDGGNFWHCASNRDCSQVVSDTNWPDEGIQIVDVSEGQSTLLCESRCRDAHPHPCFSPRGDEVLFTSDMTGSTQIYVAELP